MAKCDYILLNRSLLVNDLWKAEPFTRGQAWVDLLLNTNWKNSIAIVKGVSVPVKRGQACRSIKQLAVRWQWSEGKVKRYLELLVSLGQISYEIWSKNGAQNGAANGAVKTGITTLITILNYELYQNHGAHNEAVDEAETERIRSADGAQTETYKEGKEGKERKETTATAATQTPTERIMREMFVKMEPRFREFFPNHDFKVVSEGCVIDYRTKPPPSDPYLVGYKWFQRQNVSSPFKKPQSRGLSSDFEKTFCLED